MKILAISDIHYHPWTEFSTLDNGINSRLKSIDNVLREAISYANLMNINQLFILGDVFHKRGTIDVIAASLLKESLESFIDRNTNNKIHILVGNHDQAVLSGTYHALKSFAKERTYIYDCPTYVRLNEDIQCLMIPYIHDYEHIQTLLNKENNADYIFGHFGVKGAALINTDFRDSSGVDLSKITSTKLRGIFLGHYHTPQKLILNNFPTYYVGSPIHHTFNDEGQLKSIMVMDLYANQHGRIKTTYPKFTTLNESNTNLINDTDYFRVRLSNKNLDLLADLFKVTAKIKIEYVNKEVELKQAVTSNNLNKLISSFIKANNIESKSSIYKKIQQYVKNQ